MTLWEAIVLGVVQGLTEFLPISSTAHLAIVPAALGWDNPPLPFKAVIQLGTLAAVVWYFRRELRDLTRDACTGGAHARLAWLIAAGTAPVLVAGWLLKPQIAHWNNSLPVMAWALIGVAVVLMLAEWLAARRPRAKELADVGWTEALAVGCAQAVALVPGSSRSGCTIAGGLLVGLTREAAARFSFLLSLPALLAAGVHQLLEVRVELWESAASATNYAAATLAAGVVGYLSIAFLLEYLKRHTLWVFIGYRLLLGVAILLWA